MNEAAEKLLQAGAIGVIPTDTLYGVVARAADEESVGRLYVLKQRAGKPGTVIAANIEQLVELGLKARYLKAVENFWPNPISVIIPCGPELDYLTQGKRTLAVRIPKNTELRKLLERTGPLVTSSANQPAQPEAKTIQEAMDHFGEAVSFYIDGGDLSDRKPSTIIRVVDDAIEVLREGAVTIDEETGEITEE